MKFKLTIEVPIYGCKCIVIIADEIEKVVNTFIKRNKLSTTPIADGDGINGLAFGLHTMDYYYIFYAMDAVNANTISHEICHAIDDICGDRDVTDAEARAYLTGYITEKVFDFVMKKKILISKYFPHV